MSEHPIASRHIETELKHWWNHLALTFFGAMQLLLAIAVISLFRSEAPVVHKGEAEAVWRG